MIADRHYQEARNCLEALKADVTAPEQLQVVRTLFSRIFEEDDRNNNNREKPDPFPNRTRIAGFSSDEDPFFREESVKRPEPKADDDFFSNRAAQNKEKKNESEEDKSGFSPADFEF